MPAVGASPACWWAELVRGGKRGPVGLERWRVWAGRVKALREGRGRGSWVAWGRDPGRTGLADPIELLRDRVPRLSASVSYPLVWDGTRGEGCSAATPMLSDSAPLVAAPPTSRWVEFEETLGRECEEW